MKFFLLSFFSCSAASLLRGLQQEEITPVVVDFNDLDNILDGRDRVQFTEFPVDLGDVLSVVDGIPFNLRGPVNFDIDNTNAIDFSFRDSNESFITFEFAFAVKEVSFQTKLVTGSSGGEKLILTSRNAVSLLDLPPQDVVTVTFTDDQGFTRLKLSHGEEGFATWALDNVVLIPVEPQDLGNDNDKEDKDSAVCDMLFSFAS